jgi:PAS domain-containing protein
MKSTHSLTAEPSGARKRALLDRSSDKHSEALESTEREIEDIRQRPRSRAAMRISKVRYRRLLEAPRDGILILDRNTHKITAANAFMK